MNNPDLEAAGERADPTKDLIDQAFKIGIGDSTMGLNSCAAGVQLHWRRVEDELPARNVVVLVCFQSGYENSLIRTMAYRTLDPGRGCWSSDVIYEEPDSYAVDDIQVTHWMPLPDPPLL